MTGPKTGDEQLEEAVRNAVSKEFVPPSESIRIWRAFKNERPEMFQKMLEYRGYDRDEVFNFADQIALFVLVLQLRGSVKTPGDRHDVSFANAISVGVIEAAKLMDPNVIFNRVKNCWRNCLDEIEYL